MLRILADENIPLLREFFGTLGEIRTLPGRQISAADLEDVDVLLVRSVTPVNATLLAQSRVQFVGTATIGTDHIDLPLLAGRGIGFASAPGCNATSVVEYVMSAISVLSERQGFDWRSKSYGIIGAGNVGGRLRRLLEQLGCRVLACDPPREALGDQGYASLDEVLACDVISLHTPLVKDGPYSTHHLLNRERLATVSPRQILINSGRGSVVEEAALMDRLREVPTWPVVLDVWEFEPRVQAELLGRVQLGTPHIAGYSLEGKMRGTEMLYQALCRHFDKPVTRRLDELLPKPPVCEMVLEAGQDELTQVSRAIRLCYDVRRDDAALRRVVTDQSAEAVAQGFDLLRKQYPLRREFSSLRIQIEGEDAPLRQTLSTLGFSVS